MTLGEKIKMLRIANQLSQESLASLLDISRQSVSKWEQGISNPSSEKLIRVSELFNISIEDLLNEDIRIRKEFNTSHYVKDIFLKKRICIPVFTLLIIFMITFLIAVYLTSIGFDKRTIFILVSISGLSNLIAFIIFLSTMLRFVYIDCKLRGIQPFWYVLISITVVGLAFYLLRRDELSNSD